MKKYFATVLAAMLIFCGGCGRQDSEQVKKADTAMGTVVQQTIYAQKDGEQIAGEIMELLRELEANTLSRRLETSELYRVNLSAGSDEGILLSAELSELLDRSLAIGEKAEGALDVTLGSIVQLWNIDRWAAGEQESAFQLPEQTALYEALESCGSNRLKKQEHVLFVPEGMQLDLGAVGKGFALDRLREYLQGKDNVTGAIISVGGSILTYGQKPAGTEWRVGITDPTDAGKNIGYLLLTGQWCVSTSGDYERYVELDGVRYHHILDPKTGYPADSGVSGVTILGQDGFLSDALSTACFILGVEKGKQLAENYEVEALFVEKDGSIDMTDGMQDYFRR